MKKLRREIVAKPKKAAALGLLLVAALYFWVPLLMGPTAVQPGAVAPVAGAPTPSAPTAAAAPVEGPKPVQKSWQQLAAAIDADPRMRSVETWNNHRDPFEFVATVPNHNEHPELQAAEPQAPALNPSEAGLVLYSTLLGSRRRMALINGRRYGIGDSVSGDKQKSTAQFVVSEIEPRRVVLKRDGERFELKLGAAASEDDNSQSDEPDARRAGEMEAEPGQTHG